MKPTKYLKLGILLFGIALFFYACQKEDVINDDTNTDEQFAKSEFIDFSKLNTTQTSLNQLLNTLNTIDFNNNLLNKINFGFNNESLNNARVNDTLLNVDAENVYFAQYNERNFTTFKIIESGDDSNFRNLLIENIDSDNPIVKIIAYQPTADWLDSNQDTTIYQGDITLEPFEGQWQSNARATYCYISSEPSWGCAWQRSSGHHPGYPECNGGNFITGYVSTTDCYGDQGGGGAGDSSGGGSGSTGSDGNDLSLDDLIVTQLIKELNPATTIFGCIGYDSAASPFVNSLDDVDENKVANFINTNGCSEENRNFVNDFIETSILSESTDLLPAMQRLITFMRQYGETEHEIIADYYDSIIEEYDIMTASERQFIHGQLVEIKNDILWAYVNAVFGTLATDLVIPVVTYALFEATGGLAVKLLQKNPLPAVLVGTRLNNMVQRVGLLGVQGTSNNIRIVTTNGAPYSKALELFLSLTKNAQSVTVTSNGTRVALMGNGNKIVFRTQSSSGFPATLEMTFSEIWANTRIVKFQ